MADARGIDRAGGAVTRELDIGGDRPLCGRRCANFKIPRRLSLQIRVNCPPFSCQEACRYAEKSSRDYVTEKMPVPDDH